MVDVLVRRHDGTVPLPSYAHPGDAGADLTTTVDVTLAPGERVKVPTGVSIALPDGYVGPDPSPLRPGRVGRRDAPQHARDRGRRLSG